MMDNDDLDNDFGFSFIDDEIEEKVKKGDDRAKRIYLAIEPFLDNLSKNPDKTTIHWPNRVEKITQFKKKLLNILEDQT